MALATMLEFGLQTYFCAIKLSAKLVFLGNGILVIPFFDIGKWLFVLTLKSHLNYVLRVMFYSLRSKNYAGKLLLSASQKVCLFQLYTTGKLETWLRTSL